MAYMRLTWEGMFLKSELLWTVEEKVLELQKSKRDLADAIINVIYHVLGIP